MFLVHNSASNNESLAPKRAHSTSEASSISSSPFQHAQTLLQTKYSKSAFTCERCELNFQSELQFLRHTQFGCATYSSHELTTKSCDNCYSQTYHNIGELGIHKRFCEAEFMNYCVEPLVDPSGSSLSSPSNSESEDSEDKFRDVTNTTCKICSSTFDTPEQYLQHVDKFEQHCGLFNIPFELEKLVCYYCHTKFPSVQAIRNHILG